MGTKLANLHVLDGDEQQIRDLMPNSMVGQWSARFISVYSKEFMPGLTEKVAKSLSKKLAQPILLAWIFDSDAVGFSIFQNGKKDAEHILNPEGYNKMGNVALFCERLGLFADDISRLRTVWKKGDAEEQLELTAMLLGLPLYNDFEELPDKQHIRDIDAVDKWIAERPAPQKIKSETKAVLIQELTRFRWAYGADRGTAPYCSVEPFDDEYAKDKFQFWIPNADGTLRGDWSTVENLRFGSTQGRTLGIVFQCGIVAYDSAGLLPDRYRRKGQPIFLQGNGLLWEEYSDENGKKTMTYTCCAQDGSELWKKVGASSLFRFFAQANEEIIFIHESQKTHWIERVDMLTGATIEKLPKPFGLNVINKTFNDGCWWICHDGVFLREGEWVYRTELVDILTKYDDAMRITTEITIPTFSQNLFFSPDNAYVYVFFFKEQITVYNAETLAIENTLKDKSFLLPLCFDLSGRFWLQRGFSTVEAWDMLLSKPRSRHKLRGVIFAHHRDENGAICIVTWSEKERVLRVYRLE